MNEEIPEKAGSNEDFTRERDSPVPDAIPPGRTF
jgi:hypothetical protein